jgi:hypothetical protein
MIRFIILLAVSRIAFIFSSLEGHCIWDNDVVLKVVLGFIKGGYGLLLLNKPFAVAQGE